MGETDIAVGVLGPLELRVNGTPVELAGRRQRALLAALAMRAGSTVPNSALGEAVWEDRPPEQVPSRVHTLMNRLRAVIGAGTVRTEPDGYRLAVRPDAVDALRLKRLVASVGTPCSAGRAREALAEALALWRGEPLQDCGSAVLQRDWAPRLTELRLGALERCADLDLAAGAATPLLAELWESAARHPFREPLWARLIAALHAEGRSAEALRAYEEIRRRLGDDLGVDPGPLLRRVHQQVLTEPRPSPPPSAAPDRRLPEVPRQLPSRPRAFTGRGEELAVLDKLLDQDAGAAPTLVVHGTGGVGKTWLAVEWARRHPERWPDGQLFVDLRGFSPVGRPLASADALCGLLAALGVPPAATPAGLDARAGLYRSLVADRRMLIVLDNARDTAQLVPLLPGSATCTTVVTSRNRLDGLTARHGAHPVRVDQLAAREARALLEARLGGERLAAEPDAVREVLAHCAGFPLALGIVVGRAETHPDFPLAAFAEELRDATTRLEALADGDPASSLPAVLSWSCAHLTEEQARVFALTGAAPGPDIALPAAASLTGLSQSRVRAVLLGLEQASLVQQHRPGRYRMHDLVRLHAVGSADRVPEPALLRVVDFYLYTALAADRLLAKHRPPLETAPPVAGSRPRPPADAGEAAAWLKAEYSCLRAAQHLAVRHGWYDKVWQLAWSLDTHHARSGRSVEKTAMWQTALGCLDRLPDPAVQHLVHRRFGDACVYAGRVAEGLEHLRQALDLAEQRGDPAAQAYTHSNLASACGTTGDDEQALVHAKSAQRLYGSLDNPLWKADSLNAVGWYSARTGHYAEGRTACEAALALHRASDYAQGEAATLDSLGYIAHHSGDHARAVDRYQQALGIYRSLRNRYYEANTLERLGHTHRQLRHFDRAGAVWREALQLYRDQQRGEAAARVERQLAELAVG